MQPPNLCKRENISFIDQRKTEGWEVDKSPKLNCLHLNYGYNSKPFCIIPTSTGTWYCQAQIFDEELSWFQTHLEFFERFESYC